MDEVALRKSRTLAAALEPVIGQVFFAPECHAAYAQLGFAPSPGQAGLVHLPDGPAYFTSRGSLMGQVRPGVVAGRVRRVQARDRLGRGDCSVGRSPTRRRSSPSAARRGRPARTGARRRPTTTCRPRSSCSSARSAPLPVAGRALFAGLRSWWDDPTDPWTRLFHLGDMLPRVPGRRAHRGVVERRRSTESRSACSTTSTWACRCAATCAPAGGAKRISRPASTGSATRGWLEGDALSDEGREVREEIELATDLQMAAGARSARRRPRRSWSGCSGRGASRCARPAGTSAGPSTCGPCATTDARWHATGGASDRVSVSFVCRGHPNVTATHDQDARAHRATPRSRRRATCVLGVASDHDDRALLALRGRVDVGARVRGRAATSSRRR